MQFLSRSIFILFVVAGTAIGVPAAAQTSVHTPLPMGKKEAIVFRKNYPFLYYCYTTPTIRTVLSKDTALTRLTTSYRQRLSVALAQKPEANDSLAIINQLDLSSDDIAFISARLAKLYQSNASFAGLLKSWLLQTKSYPTEKANGDAVQLLTQAWQQDASGMNYAIGVYGKGNKPNYPLIDSISFDVHNRSYGLIQDMIGRQIYKETDNMNLFFAVPLEGVLRLLAFNDRFNAADFEPMEKTVNAAAIARLKTINWSKYAYSHIAVLGAGAENREDSLNPVGVLRCRLAAIQYFAGRAPFIFLSGGRVHPYKTNFSEALEMKEYLMSELGVPAAAIIMEPHARHTTTNIRNIARLLVTYGFPMNKPGIISTTYGHNTNVLSPRFQKRCIKELGYVPYKLGKELSDTETEYYALPVSFRVNPTEPLDP